MDDKKSLLPQTESQPEKTLPHQPSRNRSTRFQVAALAFVLAIFWLATSWPCSNPAHPHHRVGSVATKVPLEVHIMSKCPDTRMCLEKLVVPAMANVSDKVDFRMSFIGSTSNSSDDVHCPHGQTECLGDILELCSASEYPSPKIYLGFTTCLAHSYHDIPKKELAQDCALEHGIDFEKLNECMSRDDGAYGMGLLRDSVQRSMDAGVSTSCTVRLDGKKRCVVDGQMFRECEGGSRPEDLIRDIEKLYGESVGA